MNFLRGNNVNVTQFACRVREVKNVVTGVKKICFFQAKSGIKPSQCHWVNFATLIPLHIQISFVKVNTKGALKVKKKRKCKKTGKLFIKMCKVHFALLQKYKNNKT